MRTRLVFAVGLPVLVLVSWLHASTSKQELKLIPQPQGWVAFVSDLRIVTPGQPEASGRFYRRSDGSTRSDIARPNGVTVMINNVATQLHYKSVSAGEWQSQPMVLPPTGYVPTLARADNPQLVLQPELMEGLEVYKASSGKDVSYRTAELNMFAIRIERSNGGLIQHRNIKLIEPDGALFTPPKGDSTKHVDKPGGIVFSTVAPDEP